VVTVLSLHFLRDRTDAIGEESPDA